MLALVARAGVPDSAPGALTGDLPSPSFGLLALQMLLALGLVCALAYVLLNWGLKKVFRLGPTHGVVKVHERAPLEPRKSVYVVEAAGQYFLVGSAEGHLSLLATLDEEKARAALADKASRAPRPAKSFAEVLKKLTAPKKPPETPK